MKRDPVQLARQIATRREIDEAAERWLVGAFRLWFEDGGDPHRLTKFLRFPSAKREAEAERNRWLQRIADELPEHNQAANLKRLIDNFMGARWPAWRHEDHPPAEAEEIEAALFFAASAGAPMNIGRHQLRKILLR